MDLYQAVFGTLIFGTLIPFIRDLLRCLINLFCHCIIINDQNQCNIMDKLLSDYGICTSRIMDSIFSPADGIHFMNYNILKGFLIAFKKSDKSIVTYELYIFGNEFRNYICNNVVGNFNDITLVNICVNVSSWRKSVSSLYNCQYTAYEWQNETIKKLIKLYENTKKASIALCGKPNTGKSSLSDLISNEFKNTLKISSVIIKGIDLKHRGYVIEDYGYFPNDKRPLIIVLDEFDIFIDYAERNTDIDQKNENLSNTTLDESSNTCKCLAQDPSTFLGFLDRINKTPYIVMIATTNKTLAEINDKKSKYYRYFRQGRFDIRTESYLTTDELKNQEKILNDYN